MKHETEIPPCARAEEVMDYLYGEVNATEKQGIEQHLAVCAACAAELAAFRAVRAEVGLWRDEILHTAPARVVNARSFVTAPAERQPERSWRTVVALLRDLFTFSPAWLRGAAALAGLACVGLMAFAWAGSGARPEPGVAIAPPSVAPAGPTEAEIQQRVAVAVQSEREKLAAQHEKELAALREQSAGDNQRLTELQAKLEQARANAPVANAPATRIVKVYVPQPSAAKPAGVVAQKTKNRQRKPSVAVPDEHEVAESSLADVMFGGSRLR